MNLSGLFFKAAEESATELKKSHQFSGVRTV
jgi:hypothetical protein